MQLIEQCQRYYATPWGKSVTYLVNMMLVVLFIVIGYQQIYPIWQNYHQRLAAVPTQIQKVSPVISMIARRVANQHLFGVAQNVGMPTVVSNIKVLGIFLASNPKQSTAVLSFEDAADDIYWPGDALPVEGKVLSIEANRVIIMQGGQRKAILFDMQEFGDTPTEAIVPADRDAVTPRYEIYNQVDRNDAEADNVGLQFSLPLQHEKLQE